LGYDPIFKTQAGPPVIQPAPSNGPAQMAPVLAGYPSMHGAPMSMTMPSHMPVHMPTSIPMGYAGSNMSATGSSPRSVYDYDPYPVIDPALESAILPPPHSPSAGERSLHDTNGSFRPDLKRTFDRASPFSSTSDTPRTMGTPVPRSVTPGASNYGSNYAYPYDDMMLGGSAKRIKINDLLSGTIPPPPTPPPSAKHYISGTEGTRQLFKEKYATPLDQVFETGWFTRDCITSLMMNDGLTETFTDFLDQLKLGEPLPKTVAGDFRAKGKQDGVILYNVMKLMYSSRIGNEAARLGEDAMEYNKISRDTLDRVRMAEAVIFGDRMDHDPSTAHIQFNPNEDRIEVREQAYWTLLRRLLEIEDIGSSEVKSILDNMNNFIDDRQGRDILWSVANTRHLIAVLKASSLQFQPHQDLETIQHWEERLKEYKDFLKKLATSPPDHVSVVIRRICVRFVSTWEIAEANAAIFSSV